MNLRRDSKRVTIADVARRAGVSPSAVSSALNGGPHVSESTRMRVMEAARELGWVPASAARALAGSRTETIGLILHRDPENLGVETFYMRFIAGLERELSRRSYGLLLQVAATQEDAVATQELWTKSRRVDGIILTDVMVEDPRIAIGARADAIPTIVVGPEGVSRGLPHVWTDDGASMIAVVEYLARLGHARIAHVSGPGSYAHTAIRQAAFRERMAVVGGEATTVETDYSPGQGAQRTRDLLSRQNRPTAVIYDNDVMAVAGLGVAMDMGLRLPENLSIVAWDDSIVCRYTYPPLTAIVRDTFETGARVARRLFEVIAGRSAGQHSGVPSTLRVRSSTVAPSDR